MRSMIGVNCLGFSDDCNVYDGKPSIPIPDSENLYALGALYRLYETAADGVRHHHRGRVEGLGRRGRR